MRKTVSVLCVIGMVIIGFSAMAKDQPGSPAEEAAGARNANPWSKVHPKLLEKLKQQLGKDARTLTRRDAASRVKIEVLVRVKPGADLSRLMTRMLVRPVKDASGYQTIVGTIQAGDLGKLVTIPDVYLLQPAESIADPPKPPDPDLRPKVPGPDQIRNKLILPPGAATSMSRTVRPTKGSDVGPQPTDWYEVDNVHHSKAAWAKGITGAGVRVMVNDTGTDFCNPDLFGTWATVEDVSSPYFGWPMMFDSYSMYLLARDQYLGETNIAAGLADYADTSATCTSSPCSYQPIGAAAAHSYILPGTGASGTYHIGSHPDTFFELISGAVISFGERAAVLVVDESAAGVYDTVYVDLNKDFDFTNDGPPAIRATPVSCLDFMGPGGPAAPDGYADLSGGLVYFIADGAHPVPASNWLWGLTAPANGSLVAFAINDYRQAGGDHGTFCASAVAAQGEINGSSAFGGAVPNYKPAFGGPGTGTGMVVGGGRQAKLVSNGNQYQSPFWEDAFIFALYGYDGVPTSGDEVQIVSNSFGSSAVDNDGWDFESRYIENLMTSPPAGGLTSVLFSTGNGGPGYGTAAPPSPPSAISVGASTEMGSTGWDSAAAMGQITYGDVIPFSNRGPGARGTAGVDIVASGAFAAGDIPVNLSLYNYLAGGLGEGGWSAWDTWGGTSRSTPIAAGNLSLVYQAYKNRQGQYPNISDARSILMSGSTNIHYDTFSMGAGMLNAERSVNIALGGADGSIYSVPADLRPGDYRGAIYPAFGNIVYADTCSTQSIEVHNTADTDKTVEFHYDQLVKTGETAPINWPTVNVNQEGSYDFNRPDYLMDIKDLIPADTDLVVAKLIFPFNQFDPDGNNAYDSRWRLLAYDWRDVNSDGKLWQDLNGTGAVDPGEVDQGEYMRFTYSYPAGTTMALFVQRPINRMHHGIYLGLQHSTRSSSIPTTQIQVVLEFYQRKDWTWLTPPAGSVSIPAGGSSSLEFELCVPAGASPGLYEGAVRLIEGSRQSIIPVTASVAAQIGTDPLILAGPSADDRTLLYNNGVLRGYFDWNWRAEAGDWRFFFLDNPDSVAPGALTQLFTVTEWWDSAPHTDIDTIIMGPTSDGFSGSHFGPYTLDTVGKSENRNISAGKWQFHTTSGGAEDLVYGPLQEGLHLIAVHNVLNEGSLFDVPYQISVGKLKVAPSSVAITSGKSSDTFPIALNSNMDFSGGFVFDAFGMSCNETHPGTVDQSASAWLSVAIDHGGLIEVTLDGLDGNDLDLYIYDPFGNQVASSESAAPDEFVSVGMPQNGTWWIEVYGYSVPGGPTSFNLLTKVIQGYGLTVENVPTGPISGGVDYSAFFNYSLDATECTTHDGLIVLGPPSSPNAFQIPVTITISYDFNNSGCVDIVDIMLVASRWNSGIGDPDYDATYDLDNDGDIDIVDIMRVAAAWGTGCQVVFTPAAASNIEDASGLPVGVELVQDGRSAYLIVKNASDLGACQVEIEYDGVPGESLKLDVFNGDLLAATARPFLHLKPKIDHRGKATLGFVSIGKARGVNGAGVLAEIRFQGASALRITGAKVTDSKGNEVSSTVRSKVE